MPDCRLDVGMHLRPTVSTHILLAFLRLYANAQIVPKSPSCYSMLLVQPSLLKLNPRSKLNTIFQTLRLTLPRNQNSEPCISSHYCHHSNQNLNSHFCCHAIPIRSTNTETSHVPSYHIKAYTGFFRAVIVV